MRLLRGTENSAGFTAGLLPCRQRPDALRLFRALRSFSATESDHHPVVPSSALRGPWSVVPWSVVRSPCFTPHELAAAPKSPPASGTGRGCPGAAAVSPPLHLRRAPGGNARDKPTQRTPRRRADHVPRSLLLASGNRLSLPAYAARLGCSASPGKGDRRPH